MLFFWLYSYKIDCCSVLLAVCLMLRPVIYCAAIRFGQFPEGISVVEHDVVTLNCKVIGKLKEHEVRWTYTENMQSSPTYSEAGDEKLYTVSLTIKSVSRSDKGEYICKILKNGKVIDSRTLELTIKEIPGSIYPLCEGVPIATEGQEITISCRSEKTNPIPTLKWYRKDSYNNTLYEINKTNNVSLKQVVLNLTLTATAKRNEETYVCKLTTQAYTGWSSECRKNIHVQLKPVVNISGSPVVEVGRETVFICESMPKAEFRWNFSLPDSRVRLEAENQILRYESPRLEDNNKKITCMAKNDVGSGYKTLSLIVIGSKSQMTNEPSQATGQTYGQSSKTRSLSFVTAVAGGCTAFLLVLLIMLAACMHYHTNRSFRNTSLIAQPDVYFEPRDKVLQTSHGSCTRSVGIQVPRDIELEFVYHEIESRKSIGSCPGRNYSTGATSV